jgi:RNA polymerase sigma-70 factor, ECF subfamily
VPFLRDRVLGSPGFWRMLPASANGQPAAVGWNRDADGVYQPYGVVLLSVTSEGVRQVRSFGDPRLVAAFGFPPIQTGRTGRRTGDPPLRAEQRVAGRSCGVR